MSQTSGGWEPVSHEPAEESSDEAPRKPGKASKEVPVSFTARLDMDPTQELLDALKELGAAHISCAAEMMAAMKEQTAQMAGWMKQLEAVLMAPRKVTVQRDKDGFAKQAVSEIVGVRDKKMLN